jgi:hypothetical protein
MQFVFDADESWSLMSVVTSYVIDHAELSADGRARLKTWRSARGEGSPKMGELAGEINDALRGYIEDRTNRVVRGKRYYRKASK